ncbi:MAG: hypothetical protein AAF682_16275 [Planctomycetota bacterium]
MTEASSETRCESCGYVSKKSRTTCALCGAYLFGSEEEAPARPEPPTPAPLPVREPGFGPAPDLYSVDLGTYTGGDPLAQPEQAESELPELTMASAGASVADADGAPRSIYGAPGQSLEDGPVAGEEPVEEPEQAEQGPPISAPEPVELETREAMVTAPRPLVGPRDHQPGSHDEYRRNRLYRRRMFQRWVRHGVAGAAATFLFHTLVGLPDSLLIGPVLAHLIGSAIFGFPLGFLISRSQADVFRGMIYGAAFGALQGIPAFALTGVTGPTAFGIPTLLIGVCGGVLPGAFLGMHVQSNV